MRSPAPDARRTARAQAAPLHARLESTDPCSATTAAATINVAAASANPRSIRRASAAYLNLKTAVCGTPSLSVTTSWRQVPDQLVSVFQT